MIKDIILHILTFFGLKHYISKSAQQEVIIEQNDKTIDTLIKQRDNSIDNVDSADSLWEETRGKK